MLYLKETDVCILCTLYQVSITCANLVHFNKSDLNVYLKFFSFFFLDHPVILILQTLTCLRYDSVNESKHFCEVI